MELHMDSKEAAMRFAEFDTDGDMELSWEEFYAMQPKRLREQHGEAVIRSWFESADTDGNGNLSSNEFFMWTLSSMAHKHGASTLEQVFAKYDANGSGILDVVEFEEMAASVGFGAGAGAIFRELDEDNSGSISCKELMEALTGHQKQLSTDTKNLLAQAMWTDAPPPGGSVAVETKIDTRKWKITARDVAGVRKQMQDQIAASGVSVADILRLFDEDAGDEKLIDYMEFMNGMREHFSFKGNAFLIQDIFNSIDKDRSGKFGFDELFEFLRGFRHSLDARVNIPKHMPIVPPDDVDTLDEIAWDIETLRIQMASVLNLHKVTCGPLFKVWDKSGDGKLGQSEFVHHVHDTFFADPETQELWKSEVCRVARDAFVVVAGKLDRGAAGKRERSIDAVELHNWVTKAGTGVAEAPPLKVNLVASVRQKVKLSPRPVVPKFTRGKVEAEPQPAVLSDAEAALVQPLTSQRAEWEAPTPRDRIPPLHALPPLPSPRSFLRGARSRVKPIFHPIRPLELPFLPKESAGNATSRRLVQALGDDDVGALATAERGYASLCVLKEQEVEHSPASARTAHERKRRIRESSVNLCKQYNALGSACMARSPETSHALLQRARTCASTADDTALTIATLANIGLCWLHRGNPGTASNNLRLAVKLDSTHSDSSRTADERAKLRLNLCAALCRLGEYKAALDQADAAVTLASKCDDAVQLAIALHNACVCHEYLEQLEEAQGVAERALELARGSLPPDDMLLMRLDEAVRSLQARS